MEIEDHCCKECESGVYPKDLLDVSEANYVESIWASSSFDISNLHTLQEPAGVV